MTDAPTDVPEGASIDDGAPPPTTDGAPPPPTAPPAAPPRPELRRSLEDKVLGGVAGGIARTLDVDAVLVRIAVVVLCLTFPPMFLAYVAAWFLLPVDGDPNSRAHGRVAIREGGLVFWAVAIVLVGLTFSAANDTLFRGFPLVPLVLIGVGVALWTREGGRGRVPGYTAPAAPAAVGTTAPTAPAAPAVAITTDPAAPVPPTAWPAAGAPGGPPPPVPPSVPRPRRRRSPLGPVFLALSLITAGVVAALDAGGVLVASPTEIVAVAMLVLGLGLLVGSVWGRARWLVLVALLLLPPVAVGTVVREVTDGFDVTGRLTLEDGLGERRIRPVGAVPVPGDTRLLAGSITVDLRDWTPDADALAALDATGSDLRIEVGAGEVRFLPPGDVAWRVVGTVGLGEVQVRNADGSLRSAQSTEVVGDTTRLLAHGGPEGGPVLDVEVGVSIGQITVFDATDETLSLPTTTPTTIPTLSLELS